ncbi:hypothetical protein M231_07176 [Tremella mesenterica]|uniref:DNA helicase Pif1-like 2B domain-containing protein n=1 Tax=Tremella mesenterica TaxID=5217 RepID=A0A4Q1BCT8_TREME|nr:hypothetical protein M231_07176 [Tremella mesenterica]
MVAELNINSLVQASKPVLRSVARSTGPDSTRVSENTAGSPQILYLMLGAQVMLTRNLWTSMGLTNGIKHGTTGQIHSIALAAGDTPQQCTPAVVMVAFPSYKGPSTWHTNDGIPVLPIIPQTTTWEGTGGARCTRRQIPLKLAYAITIHKCQGLTLPRAVINIGESDFSGGLTFVAVSRVKTLDSLAF